MLSLANSSRWALAIAALLLCCVSTRAQKTASLAEPVLVPQSDSFTRANQGITSSGNWSNVGLLSVPQIVSNTVEVNAQGSLFGAYWSATSFPNDQYSEIAVTAVDSTGEEGPCVRVTPNGSSFTAYCAIVFGPLATAQVGVFFVSDTTGIATPGLFLLPVSLSSGDAIRLTVSGQTLTVTRNGRFLFQTGDTRLSSGSAGVIMFEAGAILSNLAFDNFAAGAAQGQQFVSVATNHVALGESHPASDVITYGVGEVMSEVVSSTQSCLTCKNAQTLIEGNFTVDSAQVVRNAPANITSTVTESDSVHAAATSPTSLTESLTESDSCKASHCNPVGFTEGHVTVDSLSTPHLAFANMTDTVSESDSILKSICWPVGFTEGSVTIDSLLGIKTQHFGALTDSVSESDAVLITKSVHESLVETLSESDVVGPGSPHSVSLTSTVSESDLVSGLHNFIVPIETLHESDSCSVSNCHPVGFTEGNVTLDSSTGIRHIGTNAANMSDSVSEGDSCKASHCNPVGFTEGNVTIDSVTGVQASVNHTAVMTDTVTESDHVSYVQCISFPVEQLNESDAVVAPAQHQEPLTETFTQDVSDVLIIQVQHLGLINETLSLTPQVSARASYSKNLVETLATAAVISASSAHVANMADSVVSSDSLAATTTNQKSATMSDTTSSISDVIAVFSAHTAGISETIVESDAVSPQQSLGITLSESLTIFDVLKSSPGKAIAESLTTSAGVTVVAQHLAALSEGVSTSDTLAISKDTAQQFSNMTEFFSLSDGVKVGVGRSRAIFEAVFESDGVAVLKNNASFFAFPVEFLSEVDLVGAVNPRILRKRFIIVETP